MIDLSCFMWGVGDIIKGSIISHSLNVATGESVRLYNKRPDVAKMWIGDKSLPYEDRPDVVTDLSKNMRRMYSLTTTGISRLEYYRLNLPHKYRSIPIVLPKIQAKLPEMPEFKVIICPFSEFAPRAYPLNSWMRISLELEKYGINCVFITPEGKSIPALNDFLHFPCPDIESLTSLINNADMVLSNDSGPAHIAGLLGTACLSMTGSVSGKSLYKHYPKSHYINGEGPCSMCHYRKDRGYSSVCDSIGCSVLNSISPFKVAEKAVSILSKELSGS